MLKVILSPLPLSVVRSFLQPEEVAQLRATSSEFKSSVGAVVDSSGDWEDFVCNHSFLCSFCNNFFSENVHTSEKCVHCEDESCENCAFSNMEQVFDYQDDTYYFCCEKRHCRTMEDYDRYL